MSTPGTGVSSGCRASSEYAPGTPGTRPSEESAGAAGPVDHEEQRGQQADDHALQDVEQQHAPQA